MVTLTARGIGRLVRKQPSVSCMASAQEARFSGPADHRYGKSSPGVVQVRVVGMAAGGNDHSADLAMTFHGITAEHETTDNLIKEVGLTCTMSADPAS